MDKRSSCGVALVIVLWMLVAMAIAAALLVAWSRQRLADTQIARDAVHDHIDAIGTRDTLLYIAATRPMTLAGLPVEPPGPALLARRRLDEFGGLDVSPRGGELQLDGTVYAGLGAIRVQLQDEAGLLPLGASVSIDVLLASSGVARRDRARLIGALEDYADADDLRRFNGAESREYERAGLPPPPGRMLISPLELSSVLGWDVLPQDVLERIEAQSTTLYAGALNINTAPATLLEALASGCARSCMERLRRRDSVPFENARQFERETGTRLYGDRDIEFRTAPSDSLRLTLTGRSGRAWRIHVRLTPLADREGPWTLDAAYRVPRPPTDDAPRPIPSPLFASAPMD